MHFKQEIWNLYYGINCYFSRITTQQMYATTRKKGSTGVEFSTFGDTNKSQLHFNKEKQLNTFNLLEALSLIKKKYILFFSPKRTTCD